MSGIDVRPSRIEGLGMFAVGGFDAGERITRVQIVREITPEAPIREDLGERVDGGSLMQTVRDRPESVVPVLRWIARLWSVASILLVLAFIVGERSLPANTDEWLGFLFFPFGICAGMVVAWWRERLGGIMTVASFAIFYVVRFMTAGEFPKGWAWLVFAAPGFLFLAASFRRAKAVAA